MARKARIKVDQTARIQRTKDRKARNVAANEDRRADNRRKIAESGLTVETGKSRPSVLIRTRTRAVQGKMTAWLEAAAASGGGATLTTAEHLALVAERTKRAKVNAAMGGTE